MHFWIFYRKGAIQIINEHYCYCYCTDIFSKNTWFILYIQWNYQQTVAYSVHIHVWCTMVSKINEESTHEYNKPSLRKQLTLSWHHHWFHYKVTSEKWVQKFHTYDTSLPRSGLCFWLVVPRRKITSINQRHLIWVVTHHQYRSFSLSRNKKLNGKPSSGRNQENEML